MPSIVQLRPYPVTRSHDIKRARCGFPRNKKRDTQAETCPKKITPQCKRVAGRAMTAQYSGKIRSYARAGLSGGLLGLSVVCAVVCACFWQHVFFFRLGCAAPRSRLLGWFSMPHLFSSLILSYRLLLFNGKVLLTWPSICWQTKRVLPACRFAPSRDLTRDPAGDVACFLYS